MDNTIEKNYRKIESEELLKNFPICLVIGAWWKENKDRRKFSFFTSKFLFVTTYRT